MLFLLAIMLALGITTGIAEENALPCNLKIIGEGAFEGTAITNISIPESVERIENRAFANNDQLLLANISADTIWIGDNAFDGNNKLILRGLAGSCMQQWAANKGIRFVLLEQILRRNEATYVPYKPDHNERKVHQYLENSTASYDTDQIQHQKSAYRTIGELKASCYSGTASVYVQSRFFP